MKDLLLHNGTSFIEPTKLNEDENTSIKQAYFLLLLTEVSSVLLFPELGTSLRLGRQTTTRVQFEIQKINNQVQSLMSSEYPILSILVSDFEIVNDSISYTANIQKEDETTVEISVSLTL